MLTLIELLVIKPFLFLQTTFKLAPCIYYALSYNLTEALIEIRFLFKYHELVRELSSVSQEFNAFLAVQILNVLVEALNSDLECVKHFINSISNDQISTLVLDKQEGHKPVKLATSNFDLEIKQDEEFTYLEISRY